MNATMTLREKYQVDVPDGVRGDWTVKRFTVTEQQATFDRIRAMSHGGRCTPEGTYTGLWRGATIVMSDTPDEIHDHLHFIHRATGRVLIAGLGLGMVMQAVARKPEVARVTVIEQSEDVIRLVADHYLAKPFGGKLDIVHADILTWKPPTGARWDSAWFDIWDHLCTDNLTEMATLHRRYARRVDHYGSWGHGLLKRKREHERRMGW